jgi:hypothetical protein
MSIYPVKCNQWWDKDDPDTVLIKRMIKNGTFRCNTCSKLVTNWKTSYLSHAVLYGFNDAYCNAKCLKGDNTK